MGIEVYFVSSDPETTSSTLINEKRVLRTLGDREEAVAVHLKELFESVTDAIVPSLQTTGDLVIELTGSLDVADLVSKTERFLRLDPGVAQRLAQARRFAKHSGLTLEE